MKDEENPQDLQPELLERGLAAGFGRIPKPAAASTPLPPATGAEPASLHFGDFRILREIGRGGMGIVYEAEQVSLGRKVALKVLPFHNLDSDARLQRFRREAQAVAKLHHTNIVTVYGVGEHEGTPYFAMRHIDGWSLDRVIARMRAQRGARAGGAEPPQPADPALDEASRCLGAGREYHRSAARLALQAAEGLAYAHERGVLHRDIKPSNLLLDSRGILWIADFGLAKAEGSNAEDLTRPGDILGTIHLMAPERFEGISLPQGDIYSLGITLYELLTLQPAYEPDSRERLLKKILHEEPVPLRRIDPAIPSDLETIVLKAIAKSPHDRYPTAEALARDLRAFLDDRPISARRSSPAELAWRWCRRNPLVASLLAAVASLLLALSIGSAIAAGLYRGQRDAAMSAQGKAEANRTRAEIAERKRSEELFRSYLAQARSGRNSGRPGQSLDGLESIRRALELLGQTPIDEARLHELRNEAIACLALPDLRTTGQLELPEAPYLGGHIFGRRLEWFTTVERDGTLIARRIEDGKIEFTLKPSTKLPPFWFSHASLSRDGRILAMTYCLDGSTLTQIWDLEKRQEILEAPSPVNPAMDSQGRRLAIVRPDRGLEVVHIEDGHLEVRLGEGRHPDRMCFDPSSSRLAVLDEDGKTLRLYDLERGAEIAAFEHPKLLYGVAWSPDGQWIATGGIDQKISLWSVRERKVRSILSGHEGDVISLQFHPDGNLLLSHSWDATSRLWDPFGGLERMRLEGGALSFAADGKGLGFWSGSTVKRLGMEDRGVLRLLYPRMLAGAFVWIDNFGPYETDFSPDGRLLASACEDGIRLWEVESAGEVAHLSAGFVESVRFHPSAGELYSFGEFGLFAWPIAVEPGGKPYCRIGPPRPIDLWGRSRCQKLSLDREGRTLAYIEYDESRLWIRGTDRSVSRRDPILAGDHPTSIALSPDGRWLVATYWKGEGATVWDAQTGRRAVALDLMEDGSIDGSVILAFSPDGRWLATACQRRLVIWEVEGWKRVQVTSLQRQDLGGRGIDWSPQGDFLACTLDGRAVHLLDRASGRVLAVLTPPQPRIINHLRFSPDGSRLAVALKDQSIQLWDLRALRRELAALQLERGLPEFRDLSPTAEGSIQVSVEGIDSCARQFLDYQIRKARHWLLGGARGLCGQGSGALRSVKNEIERKFWHPAWNAIRDPEQASRFPKKELAEWKSEFDELERLLDELKPGLAPPAKPINRFPEDGGQIDPTSPALESTAYASAGGESHHGWSRWQVREAGGEERDQPAIAGRCPAEPPRDQAPSGLGARARQREADGDFERRPVLDLLKRRERTRLALPAGLLLSGKTYFWRVQHLGSDGQISTWSEETSFTAGESGLEPIPVDLSASFNADVIANLGDAEDDAIDPGDGKDHPRFAADGFTDGIETVRSGQSLPENRRVGVHRLGDYSTKNAVQLSPADRETIRIPLPRQRCRAVRFLLAAGWGNATLSASLEYTAGKSREFKIIANNYTNDIPTAGADFIQGDAWPVWRGLRMVRAGKLSSGKPALLYESIIEADPNSEPEALILDPTRSSFQREATRLNLFAITVITER